MRIFKTTKNKVTTVLYDGYWLCMIVHIAVGYDLFVVIDIVC